MRVLIVDDERPARTALSRLCTRCDDIEVIGEADTGATAIDFINKSRPDVVFLEVRLPDMSGFDVLRVTRGDCQPLAVMMTDQTKRPPRSFDTSVFDYLRKPVCPDRFAMTLERVRRHRDAGVASSREVMRRPISRSIGACAQAVTEAPQFLIGERERRLYPLPPEKIDFIESDGNYVKIRSGGTQYISRDTIKHLSCSLASVGFVRIERSLLINIGAVEYVERVGRGTFAFILSCGFRAESGARYREGILKILRLGRLPRPQYSGLAPVADSASGLEFDG